MPYTKAEQKLIDSHGGHWGNHKKYPATDWQSQVANGDTRLGHWDWVIDRVYSEEERA